MPVFKYRDPQTGEWINVAGGGGAANIPIQDEPPTSGDLWVDTSEEGASGGSVDAYTKEETLSEGSKTMFGLGADAVPDDVFGVLSRFQNDLGNDYVWAKGQYSYEFYDKEALNYLGIGETSGNVQYSNEIQVLDGVVSLVNPSTTTLNTYFLSVYKNNRYFSVPSKISNLIAGDVYSHVGEPTKENSYWKGTVRPTKCEQKFIVSSYVNSPNPDAYPVDDGFIYIPLGRLGSNTQIATGRYTGTGTYGSENPNSLMFDFVPKFLLIYSIKYVGFLVMSKTSDKSLYLGRTSGSATPTFYEGDATFLGTKVTWYHSSETLPQMNALSAIYNYIAIG